MLTKGDEHLVIGFKQEAGSMTRYFTRSVHVATPAPDDGGLCDWEAQARPDFTVHEVERETWTGLLDAAGREIHRDEKIRLGFEIPNGGKR